MARKRTRANDNHHARPASSNPIPAQSHTSQQSSLPFLQNLYEDILENIFSFLPIKQAIRASTIAHKFKNSWHSCRKLIFEKEFCYKLAQKDLVELLERVFDSNEATNIQAFTIFIDPEEIVSIIEKWLQICIEKEIQELELNFLSPFPLESHFLDIQTLRTLKLVNCVVKLPRVLSGLRLLKTLTLKKVIDLTDENIEALLSHCKNLATLDLSECRKLRVMNVRDHQSLTTLKIACCPNLFDIRINVPTLRFIFYCGKVISIHFLTSVTLKEAFINFHPPKRYLQSQIDIQHLIRDVTDVTVLTTSSVFIESLSTRMRNGQYRAIEFGLLNLKELQIFMEGGIFCNPYDIAVFLKGCPYLERLFIDLNDYKYECGMFWKMFQKPLIDQYPYYFPRLKYVKLTGFKFEECELELVKLLLQKSFNLEALVFITPRNNRTRLIYAPDAVHYRNLFQSWAVSPKLKMNLYEHINDPTLTPSHPKYWY